MTASRGRRILIDGSMARAGGGFTYLVNLVPRLTAQCREDQFLLWLRNPQLAASLPPAPNLEVQLLPDAGWARRLRFTMFQASRLAREWGADLYFSTSEYTPRPPCKAIASFRNANVFTSVEQPWPWSQRLRLGVLRRLALLSARRCDRILFVSNDAASWIGASVGLPHERRAIVPHGVDAEYWSTARAKPKQIGGGRPYMLSVGTIYQYKNYLRLIEAWRTVAQRRVDVPDLVIIGTGHDVSYRRRMELAREAAAPLASCIHLLGEVPYDEVRDWYAGASLFVFPSYLETFGHPMLEAMAMELPVVASDIPVFREIGGDAVRCANPFDSDALADAIEAVLASPQLRTELAHRGRERALANSWDRSARGHAELFEALLASHPVPTETRPSTTPNAAAGRLPIAVLVIARDEELNLPDCLHSVVGWAEQVLVLLDPRTRDRTREIAEGYGVEIAEHSFETHAGQKNWALDSGLLRSPWVLILDADERVSPALVEELREIVHSSSPQPGYALKRRFIFYGRWMKHCWYSSWDIRLFQRGRARYEERAVHEHMMVEGPIGFLRGDLIHNDFKDMDSWIAKHNHYATIEASEVAEASRDARLRPRLLGTPMERRRFVKQELMGRVPFRPLFAFLYLYFWKRGFLDGRLGLRFCVMHAMFDGFVTAKTWERRFLASRTPPNYYRQELASYLARHREAASRYAQTDLGTGHGREPGVAPEASPSTTARGG